MRKVIISGASSGIGKSISEGLLKNGHTVIGISRSIENNSFDHIMCKAENNAVSPPRSTPSRFIAAKIDLSDIKQLESHLKQLASQHPDVDTLICNAGKGMFGSLEEFSCQQIQRSLEINLISQIFLVKAFISNLKKQGVGNVIFIGSEASLNGSKQGSIYCAAKFALRGFAQSLREECSKNNIKVSIINPGLVDTAFFDSLNFAPGEDPENSIPAKEIAATVEMILSSDSFAVFDEINISPLKNVVRHKKNHK